MIGYTEHLVELALEEHDHHDNYVVRVLVD